MKTKVKPEETVVSDFDNVENRLSSLLDKRCLYYDSELKGLYRVVKELYDIVKNVYQRFDRRKTIEVSSSQVQYLDLINTAERYPEVLYSFRSKVFRICIVKVKKFYHVYANDDTYFSLFIRSMRIYSAPYLYGTFDKVEDCFDLFYTMVLEFVDSRVKNGLF